MAASILVDAGPDLREQALAHRIRRVDAIVFTHGHADHILGLDDVRRFNVMQGRPMPCYGDARTIDDIRQTFAYAFDPRTQKGGGLPQIETFTIARDLLHRPAGDRAGADLARPAGHPRAALRPLRLPDRLQPHPGFVVAAARRARRARHRRASRPAASRRTFPLAEAIDAARRIGARGTLFTHMCHDLPHEATSARLPAGLASWPMMAWWLECLRDDDLFPRRPGRRAGTSLCWRSAISTACTAGT